MSRFARFVLVLSMLLMTQPLWAQRNDQDAAAGAAAVTGCFACGTAFIVIFIGIIALNIALLVWVARDAKNRGMDNAVIWMILVMVTGVLGLVIYFLSRPKGELMQCGQCQNKRLQSSAKCPHCGNA